MTEYDFEPNLPQLDAGEERRLCALLGNAFAPGELDAARHERILRAALEDPFAEPSPGELVESERLRRALDGQGDHLDLILARALSAAHAPSAAPPHVVVPAPVTPTSDRTPARVLYLRFGGVAAALAVAALVLFTLGRGSPLAAPPELPALLQSRSTAVLFQELSAGDPSARIDRIASVRERDLRANRYALWGVR